MPIADLPDCRLHYHDADYSLPWEAAGPPVVFLHGLGGSWRNWLPQIPWVARYRRVLAVDCRGAGASSAPDSDWTTADMARDVALLLDQEGIARAAVVGLSMGGTIAMQFALDFPDRLAELVLVDTLPGLPAALREMAGPALDEIMTQPMAEIARARITNAFTDAVDPRLLEHSIAEVAKNDLTAYRRAARATFAFNVRERLGEIAAPTTIIFGAEDRVTPTVLGIDLHEQIPHSTYCEVPGGGHIVNVEFPEAFNAYLATALGIPAPAPMPVAASP